MNVHKNARQTPRGRVLMMERIEGGLSVRQASIDAGVSERTTHRWLRRWRSGDRELVDHSSAPHHCRRRLGAAQVERIRELRRQRLTGVAIAQALGLARSTVGLVLRRLGLNRLALLEPRPPVIRYERERPGEMIHLDIKSLGRFERIGHRISGDRTGQSKSRGIGWDHLHVAIDDASRLAYTEVLPGLGREDATAFLTRALQWFGRLGVTVERVMTDNGSAYRSKLFGQTLQQAGIRHVRTRPYTPRTNGKAERFIQTSLREWAYARPYPTSAIRNQAVGPWTDAYNLTRPHAGIAGLSPFQRLNNLLGNDI
ncbi:MAG: IS481 family transposase [Devosia sp.]|uniref:IS481 family transposase n=1 Tax=Devosia sp. TaxID=1871048 RepID=UPI001ACFFF4E|nr:IS481 family transposase [Devosia sp.]MBN9307674.1 IS481 family transposase [Devosia sp.]